MSTSVCPELKYSRTRSEGTLKTEVCRYAINTGECFEPAEAERVARLYTTMRRKEATFCQQQERAPFSKGLSRCQLGLIQFQKAEGVGFEPTLATRTRTVFKTVSINRSDTPPWCKGNDSTEASYCDRKG